MSRNPSTTTDNYTERLVSLEYKRWKSWLDVQRPYRWNIRQLQPGKTLDIGCGIGRYLKSLPDGSVGVDHNAHSIKYLKSLGLIGFTPAAFTKSRYAQKQSFDSLFLSHVLEHMTPAEGVKILKSYMPYLKSGGQVIICCPQETGYASDATHVTFLDDKALRDILEQAGFEFTRWYSFPFPRLIGKLFRYNEFVVLGRKP